MTSVTSVFSVAQTRATTLERFEAQRHRGTQRSASSAMQSCEGAFKAFGVRIGNREPPPNQPPRNARCRTPGSHRTRSVRLRTALTGRTSRGPPDLAFHARLMDLALQAASTAGLLHAIIGLPVRSSHCPLPTAHCPLPTSHTRLRFRPVRPAPPARGATPGQPHNEDARPVRAALSCGPDNAPPTPMWRRNGF